MTLRAFTETTEPATVPIFEATDTQLNSLIFCAGSAAKRFTRYAPA